MFIIGEMVFVEYGVESYINGKIKEINDNKISIQCNGVKITTNISSVHKEKPEERKYFFLSKNK